MAALGLEVTEIALFFTVVIFLAHIARWGIKVDGG